MDKQRQRKLDARTRRQESLHPEMINTKIALVEKKPKVEVTKKDVQPTKAKSNSLPVEIKAKKIAAGTNKTKITKDVTKKKHNSKGRK